MLKWILLAVTGLALWTALTGWALLEGWTRDRIAEPGNTAQFLSAIREYIEAEQNGHIALVLIESGEEFGGVYVGRADYETIFPLASASKWLTAVGVMKLVENGGINLDAPAQGYLKRWALAPSQFNHDEVTVRRLLSHTAGLTDGLGFGDYQPEEVVPTIIESLNNPRALSGERPIVVGTPPGSEFAYSGGGYLILELLVEDVTGISFEQYMQAVLFEPLGMSRTTYVPLSDMTKVAPAETDDGAQAPYYQYASKAATGLASTPQDLTELVIAMIYNDLPLDADTLTAMRQPEANVMEAPVWGLGTILYAPNDAGSYVYGHSGQNEPAINADVRINPGNGDAIIVLATGNSSVATRAGFLWTFWQTGRPDFLALPAEFERLLPFYLAGVLVIILTCIGGAFIRHPGQATG